MSKLESMFELQLKALKLNGYRREVELFKELTGGPGKGSLQRLKDTGYNNYRFDFVFDDYRIAVEIQGGQWMRKGAHNTGKAINRDCKKHNDAVLAGWTVLLFSGDMVKNGEAVTTLKRMIEKVQE